MRNDTARPKPGPGATPRGGVLFAGVSRLGFQAMKRGTDVPSATNEQDANRNEVITLPLKELLKKPDSGRGGMEVHAAWAGAMVL